MQTTAPPSRFNCTAQQVYVITEPTPLTATGSFVTSTCGNPNGSASVIASGGSPGYTYSWSPVSGSGATLSNISAGIYIATIADTNSCTFTVSITVPDAASPTATGTSTDATCFGACDGTATVTASGASPFAYSWSPAPGGGQGTATATGLCAGAYTCTVTDTNSCTVTQTFIISEPLPVTATTSQVDVSCFGACNGSAVVTAAGGTGSYSYSWAPAGGTSDTATALCPGSYTCTITDQNSCTTTVTVSITEPPQLAVTVSEINATCNGVCDGQIDAVPSGGTGGYTFNWSATNCTTASCTNICAGSYTVTVTDTNACTIIDSVLVTEPTAITITATTADANCNQSDGSASATFSGGTGTLTAVWYNPQQAPGSSYNNIAPGNYFVVVTDQNGCDDTAQVTVNNRPGVVASPGAVTNVSCFGGSNGAASVVNNNVNPVYTYSWTPAVSTASTATNLAAGAYVVTVTDSVGCTSTVTLTVTEPPQISLTATALPGAICAGQLVQMGGTISGGTPGFQYAWMPGPLPGLNQVIAPAATGTYTLFVTDANGCTDSSMVNVTVNDVPVAALSGDTLQGCATHCVSFTDLSTVASGTITSWLWDFGNGNTATLQNPLNCYDLAGPYNVSLTVTTAAGCTGMITMQNYVTVFPNPSAAFTAGPQPTTELNPTITFTDGSTGATSWSWNFGDFPASSSSLQNPVFSYAGPGCYEVTLTASNIAGCSDSETDTVCIDADVTLYVPNAFTPNEDGRNEIFRPGGVGLDPDKYEIWIFDRWGNVVYHSKDINEGWDGSAQGKSGLCQEDVYIWKLQVADVITGETHYKVGHVTLIR
jgi:gliding motility-associated-like protein